SHARRDETLRLLESSLGKNYARTFARPEKADRNPGWRVRWGLHRAKLGTALQSRPGHQNRPGEPQQFSGDDAAAVRGLLGNPRPAQLRLSHSGFSAAHAVRRGHRREY